MVRVSERDWATLVGFLAFVGLRLLDAWLPKGRHVRWMDRWLVKDDDPAKPEDGKG